MSAEHPRADLDALLELLAERSVRPLTADEESRLAQLIALHPNVDIDEIDRLAAAVELSLSAVEFAPLPASLRSKVLLDADSIVSESRRRPMSETDLVQLRPSQSPATATRPGAVRLGAMWPWLIAAASLLLALWAWAPRLEPPKSLAERRAALLTAKDVIQTKLADAATNADQGDLVWSPSAQQGYLRINGLAANDPSKSQYQLWIFDANQDQRYPIDGGVFDIDGTTGDVIVPIHAAIKVAAPVMFAVTAEKPGGVVVSSRERIKLLGKVGG